MSARPIAVNAVLARAHVASLAVLAAVTAAAWAAVAAGVGADETRPSAFLLGWALMMAAMMLPSAAPMVATYAMLGRKSGAPGDRIALFVAAYLLVWAAFSVAATAVHWTLQALDLLSPIGSSTSGALAGALLLIAGAFQFTSFKRACLLRCRSPLGFLITEWRDGAHGALLIGLRHGLFCIGCCWAMMALLFAFGVMSLPWVGLLATAVAVEKVAPGGDRFANWLGATLLLGGAGLIATAILRA